MRIQNYPDSLWAQDIKSFRGEDGSPYLRFHEHDRETPTWIKDGDFEPVKILTEDQLQVLYDTEFDILPTRQAAKTALDNDALIPRADIYLFTDGSYRPETNNAPEAAGAGALLMDSTLSQTLAEVSRKVEPPCHSYHSEVHALIIGLRMLLTHLTDLTPRPQVSVLTDSRSCLTHLESLAKKMRPSVFKTTVDMVDLIGQIQQLATIRMVWIPGHNDIKGNEEADRLAKAGLDARQVIRTQLPPSKFRFWIRTTFDARLEINLANTVRRSTLFPQAPPRGPFKFPMESPPPDEERDRRVDISLFRLYSGHTNTQDHWKRIKGDVENPECRRCKSHPESAQHLLLECPPYGVIGPYSTNWTKR